MKYGFTIALLILSAIAQASGYNSYYYQRPYYPPSYDARAAYPTPGYPAQNQYVPYGAATYQMPAYPRYSYPPAQNYRHYYYAPYQGNYYSYPQNAVTPSNKLQENSVQTTNSSKPSVKQSVKHRAEKKSDTINKHNTRLSALTKKHLTQSARKKQFLKKILPLILNENKIIQIDRKELKRILNKLKKQKILKPKEKQWTKAIAKAYKIPGDILNNAGLQQELIKRVDTIAPSMALAQAANESAWGTSRFSQQGKNLFGIWTYNPKIGIKPLRREPGKKHFVRKFSSFQESVAIYMHTLNTHTAYKKLRELRYQGAVKGETLSGYELSKGLEKYSAKGKEYIKMIQAMINKNNLENITTPEMALN